MSGFSISDAAVEAAAKALHDRDQTALDYEWGDTDADHRDWVRAEACAAIEAFLEAEGFRVESNGDKEIPFQRLISPWRTKEDA